MRYRGEVISRCLVIEGNDPQSQYNKKYKRLFVYLAERNLCSTRQILSRFGGKIWSVNDRTVMHQLLELAMAGWLARYEFVPSTGRSPIAYGLGLRAALQIGRGYAPIYDQRVALQMLAANDAAHALRCTLAPIFTNKSISGYTKENDIAIWAPRDELLDTNIIDELPRIAGGLLVVCPNEEMLGWAELVTRDVRVPKTFTTDTLLEEHTFFDVNREVISL